MSTNFYYTVDGGEQKHIGKANSQGGFYGITTFQGEHAHTLAEFKEILLGAGVEIRDEYNAIQDVAEWVETFIDGHEPYYSLYNIGYLHGARIPVDLGYQEDGNSYWVDMDRRALFHRGEFF